MLAAINKYSARLTILSVVGAVICGLVFPNAFESIRFIGDLFINLLKAFALPLICSALVAAIGGMGSGLSNLRALARNVVVYMVISEIMAVTIALVLFNTFKPGVGLNPDFLSKSAQNLNVQENGLQISSFVLSIFPHNLFESLAKFDLLPAVIFSIIFGIGCSLSGKKAEPILHFFVSIRDVSTKCLHGVMLLAPLGIFVLIGFGVAQAQLSGSLEKDFEALLSFVLIFLLGLLLHALWQLLLVAMLTKQNILQVLRRSLPVFSTAFATSSSVTTLPIAIDAATSLSASPVVARFMLPLCASINIGGMMMYEVAAALFFSQMLGYDLSLSKQILVAIACILGGMAEGGIPETSLVSLVVVFKIVNVPLSAISVLLPLDRLLDRARTVVNIFGNMCGVLLVSRATRMSSPTPPPFRQREYQLAPEDPTF